MTEDQDKRTDPPAPPVHTDGAGTDPGPPPAGRPPRWRLEHILVGVAVLASGLMFSAYRYFARDLPSTSRLEMIEPTLKTAGLRRGLECGGRVLRRGPRARSRSRTCPPTLVDAFVSVEDRKFYSHWGVDLFGIARAVVINVRHGGRVQGGSTITQQLARNLFDMFENTLTRKIKEAMLAMRIERAYSKDEILRDVSEPDLLRRGRPRRRGGGADVLRQERQRNLTIGEATMLAGLPKNPRDYSPINHLDRALQRRDVVLNAMVETHKLTRARGGFDLRGSRSTSGPASPAQSEFAAYFLEEVRQYLEEKYGADRIYRDGLKVYTGLDPALQHAAEDSMEAQLARIEKLRDYQVTKRALRGHARQGRGERSA